MLTPNPLSINLAKEFAMARFTQPLFASPARVAHPGEQMTTASGLNRDTEGSRTLAGLLLAAVLSALLVVADQVIDTWADGHLLVGWVALWTVAFAALALLAPPLRQVTSTLASLYSRWARASALRRQDAEMWEQAKADPRVMTELQVAWIRNINESLS